VFLGPRPVVIVFVEKVLHLRKHPVAKKDPVLTRPVKVCLQPTSYVVDIYAVDLYYAYAGHVQWKLLCVCYVMLLRRTVFKKCEHFGKL